MSPHIRKPASRRSSRAPIQARRRLLFGSTLSALAGWAGLSGSLAHARAVPPGEMPDVKLRHRDGHAVRWRSDVLRDRIAVVNFVYTNCTSLCPPSSAVMAGLQDALATGSQGRVTLVSISIDPLTDTPQRLDSFASRFNPGAHWWWLTGAPGDVFGLLDSLEAGTGGDPQSHAPLWLVGRAGRGPWRRLIGVPALGQFESAVRDLQ